MPPRRPVMEKVIVILIGLVIFVANMMFVSLWPRPFWWYWTKPKKKGGEWRR